MGMFEHITGRLAGRPCLVAGTLLWMLQPAAAGLDRHSSARLHGCFAAGKLLDLTNGSVGLPNCVDQCVPPAERTVQAEGVGFCMLPVVRKEAFDLSFTLELRNVTFRQLPSAEQLRANVQVALGQALQVAPADVLGEVMVRDSGSYDSHTLHSFKLRRRDEVDEPSDEPTVIPPKDSKFAALASRNKSNKSAKTGVGGKEKENLVGMRGKQRSLGLPFSPCRSGFCNMYLTMRCEVWRIANAPGVEQPDSPFVTALQTKSSEEVVTQLGLSGNWSVLQLTTAARPKGSPPLEAAHADPVFRFIGLPWNYDPVHGNLTGKWNEFGEIDPRMKYEDKAIEQIMIAFFVLIALVFAILGQQRFIPSSSSVSYSDSADWQSVGGLPNRTFRRPWPMRKETRKMLGLRTA